MRAAPVPAAERALYAGKLAVSEIPEYMHGGLLRYIVDGIGPGDFLSAVLANDLREACGRADGVNRHLLWQYVRWLYNEAPSGCWGSPEEVDHWLANHSNNSTVARIEEQQT